MIKYNGKDIIPRLNGKELSRVMYNGKQIYSANENDNYPYEEERRLFYVALTRTKNNVYLFVNKKNESIFVKEIVNNYKSYIQIFKNYL